jgi:adenylate cyclase
LIVAGLAPRPAFVATLFLTLLYVAFNGFLLFDKMGLMVALAGPLAAAAVVWAVLTVTEFAVEWAERARITSRFRYYVDPALVNYVIDHPEQVRFGGEMRELTVAVTDLVGFTALTESLREKTVEVLNAYMNCMVPLIRTRGGYVNKFLGDGIMFFFGAPVARRDHAAAAVAAVLQMHTATDTFAEQRSGDPCALSMRAGISSGTMVVGDAGADAGSDYTVLGDAVNVCFRLEPANKVFGTRTLITEATVRLLEGQFLVRSVGLLALHGRVEPVMAYEPLCPTDKVTDSQQRLADLTDRVVTNFIAGQFDECLAAAERLEAAFGPSPLSRLYARLAEEHKSNCPPDFDGRVAIGK